MRDPTTSTYFGKWSLRLAILASLLAILVLLEGFRSTPSPQMLLFPLVSLSGLLAGIAGLFSRNERRQAAVGIVLSIAVWVPVIAFPPRSRVEVARAEQTHTALMKLQHALKAFKSDTGRLPASAEGLQALLHPPVDVQARWKGPYATPDDLDDKWGHTILYRHPLDSSNGKYELTSAGPDNNHGTPDDLVLRN